MARFKIGDGWLNSRLTILNKYDIRKLRPSFWSRRDARDEARKRIHGLDQTSPVERRVRRELERCKPKRRCRSPACAKCHRDFQILFVSESLQAFAHISEIYMVTLLKSPWLIEEGKLNTLNLKRVKKTLNKQLARIFPSTLIIGIIEIVWKSQFKRFAVHVHLAMVEPTADQEERLDRLYVDWREMFRDPRITQHRQYRRARKDVRAVDIRPERPQQRAGLFSYAAKGKTSADGLFVAWDGSLARSRPERPPPHVHSELLLFLHHHKETGFVLSSRAKISTRGKITKLAARKATRSPVAVGTSAFLATTP